MNVPEIPQVGQLWVYRNKDGQYLHVVEIVSDLGNGYFEVEQTFSETLKCVTNRADFSPQEVYRFLSFEADYEFVGMVRS